MSRNSEDVERWEDEGGGPRPRSKIVVDRLWLQMLLDECLKSEKVLHRFSLRHAAISKRDNLDDVGLSLENLISYIEDKLADGQAHSADAH